MDAASGHFNTRILLLPRQAPKCMHTVQISSTWCVQDVSWLLVKALKVTVVSLVYRVIQPCTSQCTSSQACAPRTFHEQIIQLSKQVCLSGRLINLNSF